MRKHIVFMLIIASLLLAGCIGATPQPTPAPATPAPTEAAAAAGAVSLTAQPWQWIAFSGGAVEPGIGDVLADVGDVRLPLMIQAQAAVTEMEEVLGTVGTLDVPGQACRAGHLRRVRGLGRRVVARIAGVGARPPPCGLGRRVATRVASAAARQPPRNGQQANRQEK